MKKYIFVAILALTSIFGARAESGDVALAPQFVFATKHAMAGLGLQAQFDVLDNVRVAPEFIFFFKKDNITAYNGNLNVHYLIPKSSTVTVYPLAGFSYTRFKVDFINDKGEADDERHDRIGLNIGAGALYKIQDQIQLFAEERFQLVKDFNQSVTALGVRFIF